MSEQIKVVVTVSEMARMCGLSRARFYQLQATGVFPQPVYDVSTRRPIYVEELQKVCLEVRRRNCGINGKPVLFYAARRVSMTVPRKVKNAAPKKDQYGHLVEALQVLGLVVTSAQIAEATKELYPQGTNEADQATMIRAIFLHLKRKK